MVIRTVTDLYMYVAADPTIIDYTGIDQDSDEIRIRFKHEADPRYLSLWTMALGWEKCTREDHSDGSRTLIFRRPENAD